MLKGALESPISPVCSRYVMQGYLDVVRWLCENGGAALEWHGLRGVDNRSKGGWTPLSKLPRWRTA
jgi:hypothetical protein